jgi:hypothetical protein
MNWSKPNVDFSKMNFLSNPTIVSQVEDELFNKSVKELYESEQKRIKLVEQFEIMRDEIKRLEGALQQIAGLSDTSNYRESELMRDIAKKALEFSQTDF